MKYIFILSLFGWIFLSFYHFPLPDPGRILPSLTVSDPLQTKIDHRPSVVTVNKISYRITPLYDYDISGLVVADYNSSDWLDVTHKGDPAQIKDLCLIWGQNLSNGVYRDLKYRHGEFTCFVEWGKAEISKFNQSQLSNNHLIPANDAIARLIKSASVGDQVNIRGQLVNYDILDASGQSVSSRNTSTIREDHDCEIILVSDFRVLQRGFPFQTVRSAALYLCAVSGLFIIIRFLFFSHSREINFLSYTRPGYKYHRSDNALDPGADTVHTIHKVENSPITAYITAHLQAGKPAAQITSELEAAGWPHQTVLDAFSQINMAPPPVPPPPLEFNGRFFGPIELLKKAWVIYKGRFWTLMGIYFSPALFFLLLGIVFGLNYTLVPVPVRNYLTTIIVIVGLIGWIIYLLWFVVAEVYAIAHADSRPGIRESFIRTRSLLWPCLWLMIIQAAITYGLSLLFIVPGVIFSVWVCLSFYILVNENLRGLDALLKSREYVRGRWWEVVGRSFGIGLLMSLVYIPGSILSSLGTTMRIAWLEYLGTALTLIVLPLYPLMIAWSYELYKNLKELRGDFVFQPSKSTKTWWTIFGILGILIIPLAFAAAIILAILNPSQQMAKARDAQRQIHISHIQSSLEEYYALHGRYPGSLSLLDPAAPVDPQTKQLYTYISTGPENYHLCAGLEVTKKEYCKDSNPVP